MGLLSRCLEMRLRRATATREVEGARAKTARVAGYESARYVRRGARAKGASMTPVTENYGEILETN